jgi:hypothetical protein
VAFVVDIKGAVPPLVIINGFTHIPSVLPALRRRYSQQRFAWALNLEKVGMVLSQLMETELSLSDTVWTPVFHLSHQFIAGEVIFVNLSD